MSVPTASTTSATRRGVAMPVVSAQVMAAQPLSRSRCGQGGDVGRGDLALVGRAEAAAEHRVDRDVAGHRADPGDGLGRLVDRHAHVALAVGLRHRRGDGELVDLALERQLGAPHVRHQRRVAHARRPRHRGQHLGGPRHGRHRLRRHERHRLDAGHPGGDQRLDEPHPVLDRDRRLRLEPVPRPDVTDDDGVGQRGQVHRTSVPPVARDRQPGRQTGGTPWRRSLKWRSLPWARARRRTTSPRRSGKSTTASITSSEARR